MTRFIRNLHIHGLAPGEGISTFYICPKYNGSYRGVVRARGMPRKRVTVIGSTASVFRRGPIVDNVWKNVGKSKEPETMWGYAFIFKGVRCTVKGQWGTKKCRNLRPPG